MAGQKILKIFLTVCPVLIFGLVVIQGWRQGQILAQNQMLVAEAVETQLALKYFFADNGRFPTAEEFTDANALGRYLNTFPLEYPQSNACPQNFIYKRLNSDAYEFSLCLPANYQNYPKGWNKLSASL